MAKKSSTKKAAQKAAAPTSPPKFEEEVMARAAADYADSKKAENIVIMDVRGISPVTDFFVICEVGSQPQLRAVRDEIEERFHVDHGVSAIARDTNLESLWLILHFGDVMVHIFHKEKRDFYALEELWSDAPVLEWEPPGPPKPPAAKKAARKVAKKKAG